MHKHAFNKEAKNGVKKEKKKDEEKESSHDQAIIKEAPNRRHQMRKSLH